MFILVAGLLAALPLQDSARVAAAAASSAGSSIALNLGIARTGVSLGNSRRWNGFRFNLRDAGVTSVNGLSLSFWKAKQGGNRNATFTGMSFGLVGPEGGALRGVNVGVVGVLAHRDMIGVNVGGGALVSEGTIRGLNIGLLGSVSLGRTTGLNLGGLGIYSRGGIQGITAAPLAVVSQADVTGLTIGGFGVASGGELKGVNLGGVGIYAKGKIAGITVGPLAIIGQDQILGFNASAITVSGKGRVGGLTVAGLVVSSGDVVEGIALSGYRVETPKLLGFSVAPYNRIRGEQRGITIGILNSARVLHGLQLGLVNHAGNNPGGLRWLPIFNFHH